MRITLHWHTVIRLSFCYVLGFFASNWTFAEKSRIAFILAEKEYKTAITLPAFFEAELKPLGFSASYVTAPAGGTERDDLKGVEAALDKADLLFVSVRRRAPKESQMKAIRKWVMAGKPVIGIRTANHAFHLRGKPSPKGHALWEEWDAKVFGGNYSGHHGNKMKTWFQMEPTAKGHPILNGLQTSTEIRSGGSLYKVLPLTKTTQVLAMGRAEGEEQKEPVAWTNKLTTGNRVFFTSLGQIDDFEKAEFRILLINAIHWALKRKPPGKLQKTVPKKESRLPQLKTNEELELELVLREPEIANPLYLNFDEKGRLWVVEYRQYPWPAGLRMVTHDKVYRNVYEPPYPPPPPHAPDSPFRGKDRISIHEDTDGDGSFDEHKVFLDGLNLATAALPGRGGVFVLNPPYLLFYADKDKDDRPDSLTPRILLSGFGLEDSHSIANNLRWGPDGWIYATHGSTVTANVILHGPDNKPIPGFKPIHRMGQFAWRYHPETHRFEIFAEGGGNAFGVEIDSKGRVFSGHNGGNTRGFHYVQGGYYRKTFGKHGNLSNPYAFGHFPAMAHPKAKRFTHTFEIYEDTALPKRYHGKLFATAPILCHVVASHINPHGSTFRTEDIDHPIQVGEDPKDRWFSPVDIQTGPDGNLYVADFHARQVAHYIAYSKGLTDSDLGRVYRLKAKGSSTFRLGKPFAEESLLETALRHPNRWHRETALRLLGDQKNSQWIPLLRKTLREESGQAALQALWAIKLCGGFGQEVALENLNHPNAHVRRWTVRLLGDQGEVSPGTAKALIKLAKNEPDAETRSQLAATARRLPPKDALPILGQLGKDEEDHRDPHLPLMIWWGFEEHANDHASILNHFNKPENWNQGTKANGVSPQENLMRRWALSGQQKDLIACASLLELAPNKEQTSFLMKGFEKAFEGSSLPPFPEKLVLALAKTRGNGDLILKIRRQDKAATTMAIEELKGQKASLALRIQITRALGDVGENKAIPILLQIARKGKPLSLSQEALLGLQKFPDPEIAKAIIRDFGTFPKELQQGALHLLASRSSWALTLVEAFASGDIAKEAIDSETLARMRLHKSSSLKDKMNKIFGSVPIRSETDLDKELARYQSIASSGGGNPKMGESLYFGKAGCSSCHTLFDKGGRIGPDLTSYDRSDLDAFLLAIVRPNAEIREGFEHNLLTTKDGRILSGFKVEENPRIVILRGLDGQDHVVPRDQIANLTPMARSLMPEGLLSSLQEGELRHLFAYLASTTPPK